MPLNVTKGVISYGSNSEATFEDTIAIVDDALKLLSMCGVRIIKRSANYRSPAFPAGSGPDFLNGVVLFEAEMPPLFVLEKLHEIEHALGRTRTKRWEARIIDLDLIWFGDSVLPDEKTYLHWRGLPLETQISSAPETLILPHPRLQDRPFVLVPMQDVAPNWHHPYSGKSLEQMLSEYSVQELAEIVKINDSIQDA